MKLRCHLDIVDMFQWIISHRFDVEEIFSYDFSYDFLKKGGGSLTPHQ